MKKKCHIAFLVVSLAVFPIFFQSNAHAAFVEKHDLRLVGGPSWVPDEIIVKFKAGVSEEAVRHTNQLHGTSVLSVSKRGQFMRLRIPRNSSAKEMVAVYKRNPNVEYAEPNFIARALMVPNDPYYSYQWHMDNPAYGGIHMQSAWNIQTGAPSVIVAIVDTGVAYEDYGRRYRQAPDLAETSFVPGYDFVNNDTHPNDDEGHGTHVTGTVAQSTNNGLGVAGIAFHTSIMPVKVLNSAGSGTYANIADGIYFAADNGASIINMSLGGSSPSTTLENAVAYAYAKGVTIVCAAGNEYQNGNTPLYPAAFDDYCIAVGATRYDETRAYYSNTGSYLDIAAPGGDLNVDQNHDGYGDGVLQQTFGMQPRDFGYYFYSGTSMAAPHVSGVAALLIANGVSGPDNVRDALEATAEDKGPAGWDAEYGWGIVDAAAALAYSSTPEHDVAVTGISAPATVVQGSLAQISVDVADPGDFGETFTVSLNDLTDSSNLGSQIISLIAGGADTLYFNWDTASSSLGDHTLEAVAEQVTGESNTDNNSSQTVVNVQVETHDVAITAIDAPSSATVGTVVPVNVTAANEGTSSETTTVSLTDTTTTSLIGSQSVSLAPGESQTIAFDWNTVAESTGDHVLAAEASQVSGEIDTSDNTMSMTISLAEGTALHVERIDMSLQKKGRNWQAQASVSIVDSVGIASAATTVTGDWTFNGAYLGTTSQDTTSDGMATMLSPKMKAHSGDAFTFTVTSVAKGGSTYDPASNVETFNSITVP